MASAIAQMTENIWKAKGMPDSIDKTVAAQYAKVLMQGIHKGYGETAIGIDYDTPDANMLRSLADNVYQFSAAKNYAQLKALSQALLNSDGKLRSYSEFKQAAYEINDTHVNQWLKTEYNTAVTSAQMASKWVDIQQNKGTLKILEFDAIIDGRTTDLCRHLNGTRKYVDDPFWGIYYPPNHFGERSTVRQQSGGAVTLDSQITYPDIPDMFKTNLAANGLAFPPGHAYYIGCPQKVLQSFGKANYSEELRPNKEGNVYISGMSLNPSKSLDVRVYKEYQQKLSVADALASYSKDDVYITPDFGNNTDWRYPLFYKDVPVKGKLPDFKIGKTFYEMESYEGGFKFKKLSRMLHNGIAQSDHVILKLNHSVGIETVKNKIAGTLKDSDKIRNAVKEILVVDKDGKVYKVL